jgi:hypothetical protein
MTDGPRRKQTGLVFLDSSHQARHALRWTRCEIRRLLILRAPNEEREQDRHHKSNDREGYEGHRAYTTDLTGQVTSCSDFSRCVVA